MAVGTGFGQLFRGIGQVGGVGIASSIFQSILGRELRDRITGPDAEHMIKKIRHSSKLVATLPPELQEPARESYAIALRAVFIFAACATLTAYIVRLPVRVVLLNKLPPTLTTLLRFPKSRLRTLALSRVPNPRASLALTL